MWLLGVGIMGVTEWEGGWEGGIGTKMEAGGDEIMMI